jgi:hypothetical protein
MLRKNYFLFVPGVMLLCLLSACGAISATGSSPTPTPTPKSAKDLVQSSIAVMSSLKTDHVVSNATSQTTASTATSNTTIKITGDEVLPGQGSYNYTQTATAGSTSLDTSFAELVTGNKLYLQNKLGKWYVLDSSATGVQNLLSSNSGSSASSVLKLTQNATYTDHGVTTLNGAKLRHLTVVLDKNALSDRIKTQIVNTLGASGLTISSQEETTLTNGIQLSDQSMELWIDDATSYLYRSTLNYKVSLDLSALSGTPTTSTSGSSATALIITSAATTDYSAFNKPVTLKAPADAISATNITDPFK